MRDTSFPSPPASGQYDQFQSPSQPSPRPAFQQQQQQQQHSYAPPQWGPYIWYPLGAVVWFSGTYWRCEAAHTSAVAPSGVPTNNLQLWTPVGSSQSSGFGQSQPQGYSQNYPQQPPPYQTGYSQYMQQQPPSSLYSMPNYGQGSAQSYYKPSPPNPPIHAPVPVHASASSSTSMSEKNDTPSSGETVTSPAATDEKRGFHSYGGSSSLDFFTNKATESLRYLTLREETHRAQDKDELKDELKGKRVWKVGGIGVFAYSLDSGEEEKKKKVWRDWGEKHGREDWEKAARERTAFYSKESRGIKPLFTWKLVERGNRLPDDALPIGHEHDGAVLFAARAWYEGGLHLGKAGRHLHNGANISYGGSEQTVDTYEVFCGPINEPYLVKWMSFRHGETAHVDGWQPVEGGREKDGPALLLAKGEYENGEHPGKCLINDDHACVGYGGGELWVRPYQILAYANVDRR